MAEEEVDIFKKIREEAPPLEDYIDTSSMTWVNQTDLQGEHPLHGSKTGYNFKIYTDTQRWYCFRQGHESCGSIIDWVAMEEGLISCSQAGNIPKEKFPEIIRVCAEKFGVEHEGLDMDEEELERLKERRREKERVHEVLTKFTELAHERIDEVKIEGTKGSHRGQKKKTVRQYLKAERAFSDDIIDELQVGFWDEKVTYQLRQLYDKKRLIESGLFTEKRFNAPLENFIIYPYWKRDSVVYIIGRKTLETSWGNKDWNTIPKYIKLRSGERYDHVSFAVKNDVFYGEDNAHADRLLITEGVTDCISLLDAGFKAISPVTTQFRDDDTPKLLELTEYCDEIVVMNDNEESGAGEEGALKTAKILFENDRNVKVAFPPRPPDVDKVDVDDYLTERDNSKGAVEDLLEEALPYLEYKIENMPSHSMDRIDEILKELKGRHPIEIDQTLKKLKKKTDARIAALRKRFEELGGEDLKEMETEESSEKESFEHTTASLVVERVLEQTEKVEKLLPQTKKKVPKFVISIKGVEMEFSSRELLGPSAFKQKYLGHFNELLDIGKSDWQRLLKSWMDHVEVKEEETISDSRAIADKVLETIQNGHKVDSVEDALGSENRYYERDGIIYYPSDSIQKVRDESNRFVNLRKVRSVLDDYIARNSSPRQLSSGKVTRIWHFDKEKVKEFGEEGEKGVVPSDSRGSETALSQ